MHVLFLCTANRDRSPTAAQEFAAWPGITVASAGLDAAAVRPVDAAMLHAADLVFVMEARHRDALQRRFPTSLAGRRVVVLGIPDIYVRGQPELVAVLRAKIAPVLQALA